MRRDQYLSFKHHIDGEFSVEQYESRKTDLLEYAVICRLTGVEDVQVYNSWVEVIPIVAS